MRLLLRCVVAVCVCLLAVMPAWAQNSGGLPGKEHLQAGEAYKQAARVVLLNDEVHGEVVHYQFDVPVGPGPFDVIRMHRVVREVSPGRPAKKMEGVLLLPGLPQLVEGIFLPEPSPGRPVELSSAALFLASHGVDVWGMDYGWSFIRYPTSDFSFLRDWGVNKDAAHIQTAMSIARWLRVTSEQGNGPIHLLGFSYGGFLVYAAAGEDTRRPGNLRNIKGIIPVDGTSFKAIPGSTQQLNSCNNAKAARASLDAGVYQTDSSSTMIGGFTALNDPNGISPLAGTASGTFPAFPAYTFTNFQAALVTPIRNKFLGGSYTVSPPAVSPSFTDGMRWVMIMTKTPAYAPNQWTYDNTASRCASDVFPVAFDDHLGDVDVPILYIARQDTGFYTTTLTKSQDVTQILVNPMLDPSLYGHADFFLANNAASEIWQKILDWIQAHR